jgi:hypothetical protein
MKMEDIRLPATMAQQDRISRPAIVQDSLECRQADTLDDATDDLIIFMPTPQPVWPRVWPGL